MDRHRVERMVTFASVPEEAPSVGEAARVAAGRLVPFSLVNPKIPGAPDRVDALVEEHGIRGLVLFPAMHRFDLSDRALEAFFRKVDMRRLPLLVHLGVLRVAVRDLLGLPSDFDLSYAVPERLRGVLERFPGIRFVVPHFGGGYFRETLELAAGHPNLSVDTSSSNDWTAGMSPRLPLSSVFARAREAMGIERILFGTDSSVFPRGWRRDLLEAQVAAMEEAGFSAGEQDRVLGGNARALLEAAE